MFQRKNREYKIYTLFIILEPHFNPDRRALWRAFRRKSELFLREHVLNFRVRAGLGQDLLKTSMLNGEVDGPCHLFWALGLHWPRLGLKILVRRWVDLGSEGPFLERWLRRWTRKFLLLRVPFLRIFISRFLISLLKACWPDVWEDASEPSSTLTLFFKRDLQTLIPPNPNFEKVPSKP